MFKLKLHPSYYNKGFFNVTVDHDSHVREAEGPLRIRLGSDGIEIQGSINRRANPNRSARIFGGVRLRDWFQANFKLMDIVAVDLSSEDVIILHTPADH